MKAELIKKIRETENVYSFIFKPEKNISWKASQFIFYSIPHSNPDSRGVNRHFTISSAPWEKDIMLTSRFDFENGSSFKKALFGLEIGKRVEIYDISGDFFINDTKKNLVFIAGGIGITPYRSMLLDFVNRGITPGVTVLYGNKNKDIVFKETLDKLERESDWLKIKYVIEPDLIDAETVKNNIRDIYSSIYYISGPPVMVGKVKDMLVGMDIKKDNINVDYFPGYSD
jgi:glycine betaine catabolism B